MDVTNTYNPKIHKLTMRFLSYQKVDQTTLSGYNQAKHVLLRVSKELFFSKPSIKILRIIMFCFLTPSMSEKPCINLVFIN